MDDCDRANLFACIENAGHHLNDLLETVASGPAGPHRDKCVKVLELAKAEVDDLGDYLEACLDDPPNEAQ